MMLLEIIGGLIVVFAIAIGIKTTVEWYIRVNKKDSIEKHFDEIEEHIDAINSTMEKRHDENR